MLQTDLIFKASVGPKKGLMNVGTKYDVYNIIHIPALLKSILIFILVTSDLSKKPVLRWLFWW